jgi:hypothetical protein
VRCELVKMHLGWKVTLALIDGGRTSTVNRDLEECHWQTEGAGDGVLVQGNENWRRTIVQVSRRPRHQRIVGLSGPRCPPSRDQQDIGKFGDWNGGGRHTNVSERGDPHRPTMLWAVRLRLVRRATEEGDKTSRRWMMTRTLMV